MAAFAGTSSPGPPACAEGHGAQRWRDPAGPPYIARGRSARGGGGGPGRVRSSLRRRGEQTPGSAESRAARVLTCALGARPLATRLASFFLVGVDDLFKEGSRAPSRPSAGIRMRQRRQGPASAKSDPFFFSFGEENCG